MITYKLGLIGVDNEHDLTCWTNYSLTRRNHLHRVAYGDDKQRVRY